MPGNGFSDRFGGAIDRYDKIEDKEFSLSPMIWFPHLQDFRLLQITVDETAITLECERTTSTASCPMCQSTARHIHSRYRRAVRDRPINGKAVMLLLHVRKFYCQEPMCPRRVFAERLSQLTVPHGQSSTGLRSLLYALVDESGGAGRARIAAEMGLQTTSHTPESASCPADS